MTSQKWCSWVVTGREVQSAVTEANQIPSAACPLHLRTRFYLMASLGKIDHGSNFIITGRTKTEFVPLIYYLLLSILLRRMLHSLE